MKFRDGTFYAAEKVSPRRIKTPEGFLVCEAVPISRVGTFEYTPLEAGIKGRGGKVLISRSADELFAPDTVASFEGKPIVVGHDAFADPSNVRQIAVGHIQNVRREGDLLLADLFLDAQRGIELVERGELEEVSCGYDARVVDDGDGKGHQEGIVGNHLALVKKARCGDTCRIGDGKVTTMSWKAAIRRIFKDGDDEALNNELDKLPNDLEAKQADEETTPPAPTPEERLEKLEAALAALAEQVAKITQVEKAEGHPELQGDEEKKCDEEVCDEAEAQQVLADAEDLCPGMKRPAADGKDGKYTKVLLDRVRRNALKEAGITTFGDSADLDDKALDIAFKAAVELKRSARNPRARIGDGGAPKRPGNAELNKKFHDFWR